MIDRIRLLLKKLESNKKKRVGERAQRAKKASLGEIFEILLKKDEKYYESENPENIAEAIDVYLIHRGNAAILIYVGGLLMNYCS